MTNSAFDRIVLLDNIDSFSYNLVDELQRLGIPLTVYRNNVDAALLCQALDDFDGKQLLVLSPGPGHPRDAGCLMAVIEHCAERIPMLGICLGFQALCLHSGGAVEHCGEIVHGKASTIQCRPHPVFDDVATQHHLRVARYHSLSGYQLPSSVNVLATVQGPTDAIPMAAEFYHGSALGFQFHPESLLTTTGPALLQASVSYLAQTRRVGASHAVS
ncbi:anthranilate synthase component II [Idiomarina tyrosinivorans]|uniref:anthranilate synthase n=1 Tax=Idiomarina tyrosinivorans TaxID=1445662 RepID=A0A432ZM14_9GAMM|nr:aminodeoxychorismate/anthranilate synthase component II [Idiomarina tyrosinivorans]RUO78842.1 anthranilate synthase component II [Idiomarina tyrosinivorans]